MAEYTREQIEAAHEFIHTAEVSVGPGMPKPEYDYTQPKGEVLRAALAALEREQASARPARVQILRVHPSHRVEAIRYVMFATGLGLVEAKDATDFAGHERGIIECLSVARADYLIREFSEIESSARLLDIPQSITPRDHLRLAGVTDETVEALNDYQDAVAQFNALPVPAPETVVADYRESVDICARRSARLVARDLPWLKEKL